MASATARASRKKSCLMDLPSEVLLYILSKADFKSLCRIGRTCKKLQNISLDETLWKQQCKTEFLLNICTEEEGWRRQFQWHYNRFARHHSPAVYRHMRQLWDRLEAYLKDNDPDMLESLRDACDYSEIQIAEQKMGCRFPADLRCSLQIHNGQQMGEGIGVYGCMIISTYFRSEGLLDAATMARLFDNEEELPGCVPLTRCNVSRKSQYLAVKDEAGFKVGQIFYPAYDQFRAVADIFITGKSFTDWFTELIVALESRTFPRIDGNIFRFHEDPECVVHTNDVYTVRASSCFMPDLSTVHPPHFFFTYRITISMDAGAGPSQNCQLETRHWVITDEDGNEDGNEELVEGRGVVGQYPMMTPGAQFSWISCITFSTTYGSMRGHFTMLKDDGEEVKIMCPTFHMRCLPYETADQRRQEVARRKKNL